MIASLQGSLIFKSPNYLIIDVGGVGYEVFIPLSSYYYLPRVGDFVRLNIHTYIREDAIQLYGFLSREEKEIFLSLIGITGIGPRLALNILSGISPPDLRRAISEGDLGTLNAIPGVGRKTAERLILELREKVLHVQDSEPQTPSPESRTNYEDALSALINLGYKRSQAEGALKQLRVQGQRSQVQPQDSGLGVEEMIKEALKILHRR